MFSLVVASRSLIKYFLTTIYFNDVIKTHPHSSSKKKKEKKTHPHDIDTIKNESIINKKTNPKKKKQQMYQVNTNTNTSRIGAFHA